MQKKIPQIAIIGLFWIIVSCKFSIMDLFETQVPPQIVPGRPNEWDSHYLGSMGAYLVNKMSDKSKSLQFVAK